VTASNVVAQILIGANRPRVLAKRNKERIFMGSPQGMAPALDGRLSELNVSICEESGSCCQKIFRKLVQRLCDILVKPYGR
jgi:hypothetical protein